LNTDSLCATWRALFAQACDRIQREGKTLEEARAILRELEELGEEVYEVPSDEMKQCVTRFLNPALDLILDRVAFFYRRFVVLSPAQATIAALWTLHTYTIEAAETTPFLLITSPERESGKTRFLETAELVVRKPLRASNLSVAVLYTKIEEELPTLLLDELDSILGPKAKRENEELRGLLCAGNRRGSKAHRVAWVGKKRISESFEVFCPRALAGIGRFPETIESRSLQIRLKRRTKTEEIERLGPRERRRVEPEACLLRDQIEEWAGKDLYQLRDSDPDFPQGLTDRQEEGAQPLLAIADLAGGDWPEKTRRALVALCRGEGAERGSYRERLLRDCQTVFERRRVERLYSSDLCFALTELEESPWSEWNHGKPITPRGLSHILEEFDIRPRQIWIDGVNRNGYERSFFKDAWSRWTPTPLPEPPQTLETLEGDTDRSTCEISQTLGALSPRVRKGDESQAKTSTLEDLEVESSSREGEGASDREEMLL
jgi:Protein of unknown function (DUF3631)